MSSSIRIKDDVYECLELNAKGYESVSDTICRSLHSLEVLEAFKLFCPQVEASIETLKHERITREKNFLVHYNKAALDEAMTMIERLYSEYEFSYEVGNNYMKMLVEPKS